MWDWIGFQKKTIFKEVMAENLLSGERQIYNLNKLSEPQIR